MQVFSFLAEVFLKNRPLISLVCILV